MYRHGEKIIRTDFCSVFLERDLVPTVYIYFFHQNTHRRPRNNNKKWNKQKNKLFFQASNSRIPTNLVGTFNSKLCIEL